MDSLDFIVIYINVITENVNVVYRKWHFKGLYNVFD